MSELLKTVVFLSICLVYRLHIYACGSVDDWGGGMSMFLSSSLSSRRYLLQGGVYRRAEKRSTVMTCKH